MAYPELANIINQVQRNKIEKDNQSLVCKAVQEYYKTLHIAGLLTADALKKKKKG